MLYHSNPLIRILYSIPVLVVFLLCFLLLSLYHYICLSAYNPTYLTFLAVHLCFILILWSYTMSFITDPGSIPDDYFVPESEKSISLHINSSKKIGNGRYCLKCRRPRPLRAHHCSLCGRCILRMDHHCPWIGNCVGINNHRYFVQFLVYSALDCNILAGGFARVILDYPEKSGWLCYTAMIVTIGIGIFVLIMGLSQLWALTMNFTMLEIQNLMEESVFDVGWKENVFQSCGRRYVPFLLPLVSNNLDGTSFPVSKRIMIGRVGIEEDVEM